MHLRHDKSLANTGVLRKTLCEYLGDGVRCDKLTLLVGCLCSFRKLIYVAIELKFEHLIMRHKIRTYADCN